MDASSADRAGAQLNGFWGYTHIRKPDSLLSLKSTHSVLTSCVRLAALIPDIAHSLRVAFASASVTWHLLSFHGTPYSKAPHHDAGQKTLGGNGYEEAMGACRWLGVQLDSNTLPGDWEGAAIQHPDSAKRHVGVHFRDSSTIRHRFRFRLWVLGIALGHYQKTLRIPRRSMLKISYWLTSFSRSRPGNTSHLIP